MKLFKQFTVIIFLSFLGEVLHTLIPFPIPASIYGIMLLFILLERKVLRIDDIREVSDFLIFIMPLLFIPSAVGLIDVWRRHADCHGCHGADYTMGFTKSKRKGNLIHESILGNINFFWHIHHVVLLRRRHGSEAENQTSADEPDAVCHRFYRFIPASFRD